MKRTVWLGLVLLPMLAIQLVQPDPPSPRLYGEAPMTEHVATPADVREMLWRACYDCHSPETRWPWYARVSPASWLITQHVEMGRSNLDFSRWSTDPAVEPTPRQRLRWTCREVQDATMPPASYLLLHPDARLRQAERDRLCAWTEQAIEALDAIDAIDAIDAGR